MSDLAAAMIAELDEPCLLVVTENGFAKRLRVSDVPRTQRGRAGVRISSEALAGAIVVTLADEVVIATRRGKVERLAVAGIPVKGRRARGVRAIRLQPGDLVAKAALVPTTVGTMASSLHPGVASRHATAPLDRSYPRDL